MVRNGAQFEVGRSDEGGRARAASALPGHNQRRGRLADLVGARPVLDSFVAGGDAAEVEREVVTAQRLVATQPFEGRVVAFELRCCSASLD